MNLLFDFVPLFLFLGTYLYKGIYTALAVLMIAMPIGVLLKYVRTKKLDKLYFWSTVMLLVAGGLTLYFRNPLFLYWKPTAFYWIVAAVFLGSQFYGDRPLAQRLFGVLDELNFENVPVSQWTKLNIAWVLFFVSAGILNIYVAYNYEEATWVKFKVFGLTAATFVFLLGQAVWLANLIGDENNEKMKQD